MRKALAALLAILVATPSWAQTNFGAVGASNVSPLGGAVGSLHYEPHFSSIHQQMFSGVPALPLIGSLKAEYELLPQGERREALGVLLGALGRAPNASAGLLYGSGLDDASARAAADIVLRAWSASSDEPGLAQELGALGRDSARYAPLETALSRENLSQHSAFIELASTHELPSGLLPVPGPIIKGLQAAPEEEPLDAPKRPSAAGRSNDREQKRPENPLHRVTAWNFDWDDNIFNMITKMVLFHKLSGAEKEVPTDEFALIRSKIGSEGEWAEYELRKDDPVRGSYRYFRDQEGRNIFLDDIKEALRKLPKSTWQGPSWDAFAYALSNAESAKQTTIITARGHSAENMLAALQFLKDEGFIKHLPPVENLYGVSHPSFGADAANPSAAKAKIMKAILDRIQATPLGPDAPLVLSRSMARRERKHLFGFSDDDWGNFETAAKVLGAEVAAGKWKDVKITVFFTGTNDPEHPPGAFVIKPDGTLRPATADEHGEGHVLHLNARGGFSKPRYKPLPYPQVVRSELATADQAFAGMYVSHPYASQDPKVVPGDDLIAREADAITAFVDDASTPLELKRIVLTRYSISDPRVLQALLHAKEKGVPVTLITDFNTSMEFEFREGMDAISDFSKARLKDDDAGNFIRALVDAGYKIHDPSSKWMIVSQPLYNKGDKDMDPIMHEKSLLLVRQADAARGVAGSIDYYNGTANLAPNPRYNRVFRVTDPLAADHALEHTDYLVKAFLDGKKIEEVESEPPLRIYYEDDSFVELAYTNGKYNPNERIVRLLDRSGEAGFEVEEVVLSQFVMTNSNVVDSIKNALKTFANLVVRGVFDDKFISPTGWGKAAVMDGFLSLPPMGRSGWGWGSSLHRRTHLYGYQRGVEGKAELDLEGPPTARTVWHDKTTMVYVNEDGKKWVYVFTGSLNNSNHFENAELQMMLRLPADSQLARSIRDSILKVAEAERQYALPLESAVLRNVLARLIGHSPLQIPLQTLKILETYLHKGEFEDIGIELRELLKAGTTLVRDTVTPDVAEENIRLFVRLLGRASRGVTIQQGAAAAIAASERDLNPYAQRSALNALLWKPGIEDGALDEAINAVLPLLPRANAAPTRNLDQ